MIKRTDMRTWPFYVIDMPINKDGNGPCSIKDAVNMTYEVWDRYFVSHGSHEYIADAFNQAERLSFPEEDDENKVLKDFIDPTGIIRKILEKEP